MESKLREGLSRIINLCDKHDIKYQILGGLSAHLYGSDRKINDIDINIPEEDFDTIYDEVKPYIVYGPQEYKDERRWLQIITLDYNGQEIDIGGAYSQKIFDDSTQTRKHIPTNFATANTIHIDGLIVDVIAPEELIYYKSFLSGDHQKYDIQAVQKYRAQHHN